MREQLYTRPQRSGERRCAACRVRLPADEPAWKTLCRECFVAAKKAEQAALLEELAELRAQNTRLRAEVFDLRSRARPALEPAMLRTLLQLAHPDRHDNSEASTKATQYLLTLKRGCAEPVR